MTKSKPLQHLLNSCKHPQTPVNNIGKSYQNSQSISWSLAASKIQPILPSFFSQNYRVWRKRHKN